jgi:hypothetical protein
MSLDSSQYVISENKETQHGRQLVTERAIVLADRDFFSRCAVVGEKEPNEADRYVQSVMAQDHPQWYEDPPPLPVPLNRQLQDR